VSAVGGRLAWPRAFGSGQRDFVCSATLN
jgi:hypothetical protein